MISNSEKEQARTFEVHQAEQAEADEVKMSSLNFFVRSHCHAFALTAASSTCDMQKPLHEEEMVTEKGHNHVAGGDPVCWRLFIKKRETKE